MATKQTSATANVKEKVSGSLTARDEGAPATLKSVTPTDQKRRKKGKIVHFDDLASAQEK
jgi:hypothetical protein